MSPEPPDLLQALGSDGRDAIEEVADLIELAAGTILFSAGEKSDALYLLTAGSLGVYNAEAGGTRKLMALVKPGETVGELGVISTQPRNATVTAIRDSTLLKITRPAFDKLMRSEPALLSGINRLLVHRLRVAGSGSELHLEPKTIAIIAAHDGLDVAGFTATLAQHLKAASHTVAVVGHGDADKPSEWFNRLEQENDYLLFQATRLDRNWLNLCARQADRIMLIADGTTRPGQIEAESFIAQRAEHQLAELVLLQPDDARQPKGTNAWLERLPVNRHFHLRMENDGDWARIARVVTGAGLGLVLSGGGARAYAHIGVLQALSEAGIAIDFIGGTSMGAIVASLLASGWDHDTLRRDIRRCFVETNPLSDYTLPVVSLVRGLKVKRLLTANLGQVEIPDLWLPFYCISSNLTTGMVHVHRRGQLVAALRASSALPGILPPMITKDGVLADGGIIDNLPVDIMREHHRGPLAAVDVTRDLALNPQWLKGEIAASPWFRLLRPPIIPLLMRAATVSGDDQTRRQASLADTVITPPLGDIDIRDWKAFDAAVDAGYNHTRNLIDHNPHLFRHKKTALMV